MWVHLKIHAENSGYSLLFSSYSFEAVSLPEPGASFSFTRLGSSRPHWSSYASPHPCWNYRLVQDFGLCSGPQDYSAGALDIWAISPAPRLPFCMTLSPGYCPLDHWAVFRFVAFKEREELCSGCLVFCLCLFSLSPNWVSSGIWGDKKSSLRKLPSVGGSHPGN